MSRSMNRPTLSAAEKAAASRILTVLDKHTLALKLTGAYAAYSHRTLESIATELEVEANAEPATAPTDSRRHAVQLAFHQSVRQLPNDVLVLFTLLAIFRATDVGRNALLDVAQAVGVKDTTAGLEMLVNRALVDARLNDRIPVPADRDRLILHPMLRTLAEDLLGQWNEQRRSSAYRAAAQYYVEYTHVTTDRWLAPDEENIVGALEWAHDNSEHELVASLCDGMATFWYGRGRARTSKRYLFWGKEAADTIARSSDRREDRLRVARLALNYGAALRATGQFDEAEAVFMESRSFYRMLRDRKGEGLVLTSLGLIAQAHGKLSVASGYFQSALDIATAAEDKQAQATNRMYLGQIAQARGQISVAEKLFRQARTLFYEVDDLKGESADSAYLAQVEQVRGHWHEAEALLLESLSISRAYDDQSGEAVVLSLLGQLCLARGDLAETEAYFQQSLALRREVEDRYGEAGDLGQFGRLFLDRGDFAKSREYFNKSLDIFRELHARADEGVILSQLGLVAIEERVFPEATRLLDLSLSIRVEVQDPRGEGIDVALLGRIALEQHEYDKAEELYTSSLAIARKTENRRGEGVNLRQMGAIADGRGQFERAEAYYYEGLQIAREVENGLDIADASLAIGSLLCAVRKVKEGCECLVEAEDIYTRMQVPGAQRARDAIARFGCIR